MGTFDWERQAELMKQLRVGELGLRHVAVWPLPSDKNSTTTDNDGQVNSSTFLPTFLRFLYMEVNDVNLSNFTRVLSGEMEPWPKFNHRSLTHMITRHLIPLWISVISSHIIPLHHLCHFPTLQDWHSKKHIKEKMSHDFTVTSTVLLCCTPVWIASSGELQR